MTTDYERIGGGPAVGAVITSILGGTDRYDGGRLDDNRDRPGAALGQAPGSTVARQT